MDPYYNLPEVSHSVLSEFEAMLYGDGRPDATEAYAQGTLLDCMITEIHRVDLFKYRVDGEYYRYLKKDFTAAKRMKNSFFKDPICVNFHKNSEFQIVSIKHNWEMDLNGLKFTLSRGARCKWDMLVRSWNMGADIKSTSAATEKEFESACHHFNYFRSRAYYMDIEGTDRDMIIGISKKNFKVFKIAIDKTAPLTSRARQYYELGKSQYLELAFKYWSMLDGLNVAI